MFYFQQLLNMAMAGIDGTQVIPTVTNMAFAILLIGFLVGLYQAAMRGGDVQALAVTAIKYLVVAMIVANWTSVFRDVNGSFNTVANFIGHSSGAGDMFLSWMQQLQQQVTNNPAMTFWDIIAGDSAGTITVAMLFIAYVLYALAIIIFCFFYTLFGSVLYVLGPLVLALIPIAGIGQLGKTYAINLMIWNAWGILYSIFGALITAIQFNRVNDVLGNGFLGFLRGAPDSVILGLVSVFYALAVALVPLIAKRIISGDVGLTAYALVRAGAFAAGTALAGISGFAAGAGASGASAGAGAGATSAAGAGRSSGAGRISGSTSPPQPTTMSGFIRSGMVSTMNSNTNPAAPSVRTNGTNGSSAGRHAAAAAGPRPGSGGFVYRPRGVAEVIAFQAGRVVGKATGGSKDQNAKEAKSS